jgi:hypothetical protein
VVEPASQPRTRRRKPETHGSRLYRAAVAGQRQRLALLAFRETAALGLLLAIHLGLVMAFFLTMPYSKFAHGIFRSAALLKYSIEKRQPNPINAGSD